MYTFIRAVGALKNHITGVQFIDIKDDIIGDVINEYRILYAVVKDELYNKEVTIDLIRYSSELYGYPGTIQDWLNDNANIALDTTNILPPKEYRYVRSEDAQMMGYVPYPARYEWSLSLQARLRMSGADDVRLTHPQELDYDKITRQALFTYNGHFIRAINNSDGIYLLGAAKNWRKNQRGGIGCLSFANVSDLHTRPFKAEHIHFDQDEYGSSFRITFDKPIDEGTLWFVIAGKLIIDPYIIQRINPQEIRLNLDALLMEEWVFESREYIDLDDVYAVKTGVIDRSKKGYIDFITQLLLNENSFYITLSNPYIGVYLRPLEVYRFPTVFASQEAFHHPVMMSNGMFPVWREKKGIRKRFLIFSISHQPVGLSQTYGARKPGLLIHDRPDHGNPRIPLEGYHFKIYSLLRK